MQQKMIDVLADTLPPLKKAKSVFVAMAIAVVFGGFGLALYLRSWIDAGVAALWVLAVVLVSNLGESLGMLAILAVMAQYAYIRVEASNRRLGATPDDRLDDAVPAAS